VEYSLQDSTCISVSIVYFIPIEQDEAVPFKDDTSKKIKRQQTYPLPALSI
jgi:hypothetical protein